MDKGKKMILYYLALTLLIIRVFNFGTTWLFIDGSNLILGNFIAEGFILIIFIQTMNKAKNGKIYKKNIEDQGKRITNLNIDKYDTI